MEKAPDQKMKYQYLPDDKQYLLLTNVYSQQRIVDLINDVKQNYVEEEDEDGWTISISKEEQNQKKEESKLENKSTEEVKSNQNKGPQKKKEAQLRKYDLSICYDPYYYCPRLLIKGSTEDGIPLNPEQIFEDVATEKVNQTVTIEKHFITGEQHASIHPCKHAKILKQLTDTISEERGSNVVGSHLALLLFLKFFADVVPTIPFDTSFDIIMDQN
eukprot:TRINITY_DN8309_c0_g1_i1.p1 TRINITY_DN8309_c0_g1~~TRINITY_DN8309_c0_g1_i1.p1  ORF type:complete len:216 (-),score=52.17 TRINITY_DN8309_c0_g1_i1:253-900(-)